MLTRVGATLAKLGRLIASNIESATSASTSTFVTALAFNAIVFAIEIGVFTLVRPFFPAIYQPRTYVPTKSRQTAEISKSLFKWPYTVFMADPREIRTKNGMDAYFFVRFLRMMVRVLLPIWLLSWIILLPITSVRTTVAGHTGLDVYIFGNVSTENQSRYWAHIALAWVFTIWIWWNIRYEMAHFVTTRQRWLIDPVQASSAKASTVLITGVPRRYLTEAAISNLYSHLPGGVAKVWLNRYLGDMPDLYDRRQNAAKKLESAETSLLNTAVKLRNKKVKAEVKKGGKDTTSDGRPLTSPSVIDEEQDITLADKLVPKNKRPTHRLPPASWMPFGLPFMGKKVDTIEWARDELAQTTQELRTARRALAKDVKATSTMPPPETNHPDSMKADLDGSQTYPPLNSAFILFNQQVAAQMAGQVLTHHMPYRMTASSVGVDPEDVIWSNLNMNPYEARIRTAISWAITIGLIIVWAIPVAFVGVVSNVHSLCTTYTWLAWLCELPEVVVGIISGILPPVLLAVLMMLLPIVLRLLARFEGMPQRTSIELSLMSRYFMFLVIHSFLIVSLSSGLIAALPDLINDPSSIPSLLAQKLPQASTFFLTYIVLQGLTGTASGFLQIVPLVLYYVKLFILGSTPRSIYTIKYTLRSVSWGTLFPAMTLLVVITLAYSIISPIINGLAVGTFFLFYLLWKYLFLWQLDGKGAGETGGLFFPKAIQHVFVGIYIQQIVLAALFFLARDANQEASAVPEGALAIVLIAFTAFFHIIINNSYGPLIKYLPLTLAEHGHNDEDVKAAEQELAADAVKEGSIVEGTTSDVEKRSLHKRASAGALEGDAQAQPEASGSLPPSPVDQKKSSLAPPLLSEARSRRTSASSIAPIDEEAGPKDFYHPASVEPAPVVWLPRDPLGLGEAEARACREAGVEVSTVDAVMDDKGHVDIQGPPPDVHRED
ncbi:uncharacterized protein BXZ73DRAFT_97988 [Epithele typhae]|uniref:uncharacterized protein n=1 Tax=Epithele typhae TaxID=378194 RepID=UPI00200721EB|nr:uncharacterized protein BXZ73DRAFT_97988 [Epithele typhae]KAH9941598.1 hypothetical protein BXZ73DRAFT_97988 [Epithele typhae]